MNPIISALIDPHRFIYQRFLSKWMMGILYNVFLAGVIIK
jgi:hypothetical protein